VIAVAALITLIAPG